MIPVASQQGRTTTISCVAPLLCVAQDCSQLPVCLFPTLTDCAAVYVSSPNSLYPGDITDKTGISLSSPFFLHTSTFDDHYGSCDLICHSSFFFTFTSYTLRVLWSPILDKCISLLRGPCGRGVHPSTLVSIQNSFTPPGHSSTWAAMTTTPLRPSSSRHRPW